MSCVLTANENQIASPFLSVKEAAKYLRISASTLYKLVAKNLIRHRAHGAHLFFVIPELNEWSEARMRDKNSSKELENSLKNDKFQALLESRKGFLKTKDQKLVDS